MNVPLLDLQAQYQSIKSEVDAALQEVVATQHFILGPQVKACEDAVAKHVQAAHGVGVSSGTDALLIALMAEGIGPGDEVITTPYTFFATAGSIARVGARPVFVDIDPVTYNINSSLIEKAVTSRTKAIIPVHLYGQAADMDPILDVARRRGLVVIEDAAQAIGAEYHGRRVGSLGDYGCFSFFPSKNLGCFGDGGMVTTNDPVRAGKLAVLRAHGSKPKYYHKVIGGNFRLDTLQAAVVLAKLPHLDAWTAARQANAARYDRLFAAAKLSVVSGQPSVVSNQEPRTKNQELPALPEAGSPALSSTIRNSQSAIRNPQSIPLPQAVMGRHVFNQYVVRVPRRDELQKYLKEQGVGTEIYYPVPMHRQECFAHLGHTAGDYPESERAAAETLALPIFPELSAAQAEYVVDRIKAFYRP